MVRNKKKAIMIFLITLVVAILPQIAGDTNSDEEIILKEIDNDGYIDTIKKINGKTIVYSGRTNAILGVYEKQTSNQQTIQSRANQAIRTNDIPMTTKKPKFTKALVPNRDSNDVSIIDTKTNTEITKIPVGENPFYVAMTKNGKYSYVASNTKKELYKINLETLTLEKTILLPMNIAPVELEISPDDKYIFVADIFHATLFVLDMITDQIVFTKELCTTCPVAYSSPQISFSQNSEYAYITEAKEKKLHVLNLNEMRIETTLPLQETGGQPITDVKITKNNKFLFTSAPFCPNHNCFLRKFTLPRENLSDITISPNRAFHDFEPIAENRKIASGNIAYGASGNIIDVLDIQTNSITKVPTSMSAKYLTYDDKRKELWSICLKPAIPNPAYFCEPNTLNEDKIDVIDVTTMQRIASIPVPLGYGFPALSQNKKYFYAIDSINNQIRVIDTNTLQWIRSVPVGDNPRGIYMQGDNSVKELTV